MQPRFQLCTRGGSLCGFWKRVRAFSHAALAQLRHVPRRLPPPAGKLPPRPWQAASLCSAGPPAQRAGPRPISLLTCWHPVLNLRPRWAFEKEGAFRSSAGWFLLCHLVLISLNSKPPKVTLGKLAKTTPGSRQLPGVWEWSRVPPAATPRTPLAPAKSHPLADPTCCNRRNRLQEEPFLFTARP